MSVALYVHWPFCKAKCPYCDFNSHVREGVDQALWRQALLTELATMAAWMPGATLGSIFFGGGTPSLMPASTVGAVIDAATKHFRCDDDLEITLEANPTSAEAERFAGYHQAGVNRLSLGVQALNDDDLLFLGREHSAKEALKAVDLANSLFGHTSFDLIYARPHQTPDAWEAELLQALTYAKDHLSLYQLTIEPNTAFHHDYHHKEAFKLPKDELSEELFLITQQIMQDANRPAYEISNHATAGDESRHNMAYWTGKPYLGIGAGAHGRVLSHVALGADGAPHTQPRWYATSTYKSPERWLQRVLQNGHALEHCVPIKQPDRAMEQILTGLRLAQGVPRSGGLMDYFDQDKITFYQKQGLLQVNHDYLSATQQGWLVLNQLLSEIILA